MAFLVALLGARGLGFFLGLVWHEGELDFALNVVDAVGEDAHTVSDGENLTRALADDLAGVLAVGEEVVFEGIDGDETFNEHLGQLDEEAVLHDVDNEAIEIFSQSGFHEFEFFPFHELALGFVGGALGLGGGVGDVMEGFKGETGQFFFTTT